MVDQYNPSQLHDIEYSNVPYSKGKIQIAKGNIKTPDGIFLVTYYTDGQSWGTELYTGKNYIVGFY